MQELENLNRELCEIIEYRLIPTLTANYIQIFDIFVDTTMSVYYW